MKYIKKYENDKIWDDTKFKPDDSTPTPNMF